MYKEWDMRWSFLKTKEVAKVADIYSNDSALIDPWNANHTKRPNTLK